MMEKYLSPAQVADALSISRRKAYDIMYQMPHLPSPVRVSERVLKQWIEDHLMYPMRRK
jgi:predicted DNA-binding transcriptional regulator AlpA